jgi:hypothetical protein
MDIDEFKFEFLRQISADPNNTVVGLVRNKVATDTKVKEELNHPNIHIGQADLADFNSLKVRKRRKRTCTYQAVYLRCTQNTVDEVSA